VTHLKDHRSFLTRTAVLLAALFALAGCNWIIPHYEEREAVLASTPEPGWSYVTSMEQCPANPNLMRGSVHAPRADRKLTGIGFVKTRISDAEPTGDIHWSPHPDFEFDGDLLSNRYFDQLLVCDFGEPVEAEPDADDACFGLYCPCEGDITQRDEAGAAYMSSYDRYMCAVARSGGDHPMLKAEPATIESLGLETRAAYKAALETAADHGEGT
jgi:hypothetical protein